MQAKAGALQQELDGARRELQEARDRKASLERECIIYQSQLEVCGVCMFVCVSGGFMFALLPSP